MGILTNLVNSLASEILDFGFGQLDAYVTRELQEGRTENAFRAADAWENETIQKIAQTNQGGGILPIGGTNYQMQLPESLELSPAPITGPLDLIPSNQAMGKIQESPLASEMVRAKHQQFIQQDPYFIQQEAARKQQEALQQFNSGMGQTAFSKNQVGTGGARDIFFGGDLPLEGRIQGTQQYITGKEQAYEPFRDAALQRQIRLKQTPGARAIGTGEGDDNDGNVNTIPPTFEPEVINNLIRKYPHLRKPMTSPSGSQLRDKTGKPLYEPTDRAYAVANIIQTEYGKTKKPNYNKIEMLAVRDEKKQYSQSDLGQFEGYGTQQPTALQNLPKATPTTLPKTTPPPTALGNLPKAQPQGEVKPSQPTVTAMQMINAISKAKASGESSAFIRDMIKSKGFDPEAFGY